MSDAAAPRRPKSAPAPDPAAPPPVDPHPDAGDPWVRLTCEQSETLEKLSRNLTEAALRSHALLAGAALSAKPAGVLAAADPDPFRVAPDMAKVWASLAADPAAVAQAQMRLWQGYAELWGAAMRRMAGGGHAEDPVAPEPGDKRWKSDDWRENPVLDVIRQSYLFTARWLLDTLESAPEADPLAKRKALFFTRQLADAFAPSNFPLTNPDVMRAAMESQGESLVRGLRNLADDIERGRGRLSIRQTALEQFKVGENVATAPGQVVFRNDLIELIHYAPTQETTYARPLLIFPPWINKFYILDLRPENSMVRWLLDQGFAVFLASWVNPGPELKDATFEDYMHRGIFAGVEAVRRQTGAEDVNAVGYCIGGTLLASTLALMAQTHDDRIRSATFFAAQTDFSEAGELLMFTSPEWLAEIERRMDANGGVLDGQTMADVFNMLRANDLVWSFFINNYLLGQDPRAFDLLFWNADQTRLPKALHLFYLDRFYAKNQLARGELVLSGRRLNLGDIAIPCFFQASKEDHIAPLRSVYKGAAQFGGPVRFMLAGSGHIAGVINAPAAKKYQHWNNEAPPRDQALEDWIAAAEEVPGSWWPEWSAWLAEKSGERIPALSPENGPLKPLEPAPGGYVKARS